MPGGGMGGHGGGMQGGPRGGGMGMPGGGQPSESSYDYDKQQQKYDKAIGKILTEQQYEGYQKIKLQFYSQRKIREFLLGGQQSLGQGMPIIEGILDFSFLQFHLSVLKFQNPVPVSGSNFLPIDPPTVGRSSISAV